MFGRKRKSGSLFKRLLYFILLATGSGAGIGGWALKDHPAVQALLTAVAGDADGDNPAGVEKVLVGDVADLLNKKKGPDFRRAGVYQVTISKVELAQALFKPGHTVDMQAKVTKRDPRGQDTVVWESRQFGERLAVVGKDALTVGWPNRPFQVEWSPSEVVFLEVYDRKNGFFAPPKRFTLSSSDGAAEFPLKSGDFTLEPQRKLESAVDPRANHIVLNSQLVGDLKDRAARPEQVAGSDRPIIIK